MRARINERRRRQTTGVTPSTHGTWPYNYNNTVGGFLESHTAGKHLRNSDADGRLLGSTVYRTGLSPQLRVAPGQNFASSAQEAHGHLPQNSALNRVEQRKPSETSETSERIGSVRKGRRGE